MSLAVKINSNNTVTACIEIPDEQDQNAGGFINHILNIPGNWISAASYEAKTGLRPTIGCIYRPEKDTFISQKPFDNWILNEDFMWEPPIKNNLRNMNFGYDHEICSGPSFYWNQERNKWGHANIESFILNERNDGLFFISKAKRNETFVNAADYISGINVPCLPKSYKYVDVHPDWHDDFIYPIYRETFGKKYGITDDNPDRFYSNKNYAVIFDGAPYFFIQYVNLCDLHKPLPEERNPYYKEHNLYEISTNLEEELIQDHPHIAGRTIQELFKLIIDWDLSYHYFDNRENTAIVCHDILSTIQMPNEIYDIIRNEGQPSLIEKYIYGDTNAHFLGERYQSNSKVLEWCAEKYWDLRFIKVHDDLNIKDYDSNHYHI